MYAASISQYRTLSFSYLNLTRRFNYALQGVLADDVLLRQSRQHLLRPGRPSSIATWRWRPARIRGGTVFGIWPFNRYRARRSLRRLHAVQGRVQRPEPPGVVGPVPAEQFGRQLFRSGNIVPLGLNFIQETTVFREFGPLAGRTMRVGVEYTPKIGKSTLDAKDGGCRCSLLHASRRERLAGAARPRLPELGRAIGLHVLRRQLRDARLRLPVVHRPKASLRAMPSSVSR